LRHKHCHGLVSRAIDRSIHRRGFEGAPGALHPSETTGFCRSLLVGSALTTASMISTRLSLLRALVNGSARRLRLRDDGLLDIDWLSTADANDLIEWSPFRSTG